jgi:hypothetical protein
MRSQSSQQHFLTRAFTLIELLVVIAHHRDSCRLAASDACLGKSQSSSNQLSEQS